MELAVKISVIIAFGLGIILLFLSMFVLHRYEIRTKNRPSSIQFWPFNEEIKKHYPRLSKLGRILQIITIVCILPYLWKLIVTT